MRPTLIAILVISLNGCSTGPAAPDTGARVRHWLEALRKPDARVRKEAAFKLGNLALTDPAPVVLALTAALNDPDAAVRCEAILALLKCGPAAGEATSRLTYAQRKDRDAKVRAYAAKALNTLSK